MSYRGLFQQADPGVIQADSRGHVSTVIRFVACVFFRALPIFIVLIGMCVPNLLKSGNKIRID